MHLNNSLSPSLNGTAGRWEHVFPAKLICIAPFRLVLFDYVSRYLLLFVHLGNWGGRQCFMFDGFEESLIDLGLNNCEGSDGG